MSRSDAFTEGTGASPRFVTEETDAPKAIGYPHVKGGDVAKRIVLRDTTIESNPPAVARHFTKSHSSQAAQQAIQNVIETGSMGSSITVKGSSDKTQSIPNPNATAPNMQAYLDYHHYGDKGIYVNMVRSQQRGHHHAQRLIHELSDKYPEHTINFGKVMNKHIWGVKGQLEAKGRGTLGTKNFRDEE